MSLNYGHLISIECISEVREMRDPDAKRSIQRKSGRSKAKHLMAAHKTYSNPFGKHQFNTSESGMTEEAFVARRQMMTWFEKAQMKLKYF